jgi:hypothetical protein
MNIFMRIIVFLLAATFPFFFCSAETHVSGNVSGVWTTDGAPYILDSTIVILQNTSLIINPGVTVRIGAQDSIKVYGAFSAIGTETDSVFFLPAEGDSTFKLIYFYPTSDDNNSFEYCHFEETGDYLIKNMDCSQGYTNCSFIGDDFLLSFDGNDGQIMENIFQSDGWAMSMDGCNMLIDSNVFTGYGISNDFGSGTIINNVIDNGNTFLNCYSTSGMTVSDNIIGGSINYAGFNSLISDNIIGGDVYISGSGITLSGNTIADQVRFNASESEMVGNELTYSGMTWGVDLYMVNDVLIHNNQISKYINTYECDEITIRDNQVHGIYSHYDGEVYVINNVVLNSVISVDDGGPLLADSNYVIGGVSAHENSIMEARGNVFVWLSGEYNQKILEVAGQVLFENNTIITESYSTFPTSSVMVEAGGNLTMTNNIIVGDNVGSVGLKVESGGIANHSYNCFWKCDTVYSGCSAGTGEFYGDPYLIEGSPFNAGLQAISPCIDAGNPSSTNDPDGTRRDMGFEFFDTRYDHPPTVYSDTASIASLGQEYSYWAKASDDGENLAFSLEGLPGWLSSGGITTLADSVELHGIVPGGQSNFDFLITVEDAIGQTDSQRVYVETTPYTVLDSVLTGILPVENSPYLMVRNAIVPIGESLTIEPGVEIYARRNYEPDGLFSINVYGQFLAQGTETDSIVFASEEEQPDYGDWGGIILINCREDTSIVSYCRIENAKFGGVKADSTILLFINHCNFNNNTFGIFAESNSSGEITDNKTWNNKYVAIKIEESYFTIIGNIFTDTVATLNSIYFTEANGIIKDNLFIGSSGIFVDANSSPLIQWNTMNLFDSRGWGIGVMNNSIPIIMNNSMTNCLIGFFIAQTSPHIYNNIITNCSEEGIKFLWYGGSQPDTLDIKYNNIWNNAGGNFVDCPEYLGQNVLVNNNGDSCDVYFNISENPMFEGGEPFSFILQDNSPCIDAGSPDTAYYDNEDPANPGFALYPAKGTIINDMGRYGGHGISNWTGITKREEGTLPKTMVLYQNYPNPFNSSTRIEFYLPHKSKAQLIIYNILGKEEKRLCFDYLDSGCHSYEWDASNSASGIYFICLKADNSQFVKKMLLIK